MGLYFSEMSKGGESPVEFVTSRIQASEASLSLDRLKRIFSARFGRVPDTEVDQEFNLVRICGKLFSYKDEKIDLLVAH